LPALRDRRPPHRRRRPGQLFLSALHTFPKTPSNPPCLS
jgi:hypothetical protein